MNLFRLACAVLILAVCAVSAHAQGELCGNDVTDAGETCDDGNQLGADGCSSRCQIEASQTREQQHCLSVLNGLTIKLTDVQSRASGSCFKNAGRGKLRDDQTLADCLVTEGDRKSRGLAAKIAMIQDGTPAAPDRSKCMEVPNFGYVDDVALVEASLAESRRYLQELIVAAPDDVVIDATIPENKYAALCQRLVLRGSDMVLRALLKEFATCQKSLLKDKSAPAVSAEDLEACFVAAGEDRKRRVAKMQARLRSVYQRKCAPFGVSPDVILGVPAATTIDGFISSMQVSARCAACRVLNRTENLQYNCELWDDGSANDSCFEEVPPSPRGAFVDGPTFAHF